MQHSTPITPALRTRDIAARSKPPDDLAAAKGGWVMIDGDAMAAGGEALNDMARRLVHQVHTAIALPTPAGRVERSLGMHPVGEAVDNDLGVALGLHVAAHHAEG